MALNYRIDAQNNWENVFLTGKINEDAEVTLAELKDKVKADCIFNLKDVDSINSCGVRAWINFIREIEGKRAVVYEECPPEVVSQINMIPNFKGKSQIKSVYASYACEKCNTHKLELFTTGVNMPKSADDKVPEVHCPTCASVMEMEELEDEFFAWLFV